MKVQILYLVIQALGFGISLATHEETRTQNAIVSLVATIINLALLYWGGFFDCLIK